MNRFFIFIIITLMASAVCLAKEINLAINFRCSTDTIFYEGINYYNQRDFDKAIECFDTVCNDTNYYTNRRQMLVYAQMWLGNAYQKSGVKEKAFQKSLLTAEYCYSEPLDPRKMERIDSLSLYGLELAQSNPREALNIFSERQMLLEGIAGKLHPWCSGGRFILMNLYDKCREREIRRRIQSNERYDTQGNIEVSMKIAELAEQNLMSFMHYLQNDDSLKPTYIYYQNILDLLLITSTDSYLNHYSDISERLVYQLEQTVKKYPELITSAHYGNLGYVLYSLAHINDLEEKAPAATHVYNDHEYMERAIASYNKALELCETEQSESKDEVSIKLLDGLLKCYSWKRNNSWKSPNEPDNSDSTISDIFRSKDLVNIDDCEDQISREQQEKINEAIITASIPDIVLNSKMVISKKYTDLSADEKNYIEIWQREADLLEKHDLNRFIHFAIILPDPYVTCKLLKESICYKKDILDRYKDKMNLYYRLSLMNDLAEILNDLVRPLIDPIWEYTASYVESENEICQYYNELLYCNEKINQEIYNNISEKSALPEIYNKGIDHLLLDIWTRNAHLYKQLLDVKHNGDSLHLTQNFSSEKLMNLMINNMEKAMASEYYDEWLYGYGKTLKKYKILSGETQLLTDIDNSQMSKFHEILTTFKYATSSQRRDVWSVFNTEIENNIQLASLIKETPEAASLLYNSFLIKKGILLLSDKNFIDAINEANIDSPDFIEKRKQFLESVNIDATSRRTRDLERSLLSYIRTIDYNQFMNVNWQNIRSKLRPNEAAIEFGNISGYNSLNVLIAIVLRNKDKTPKVIEIGRYSKLNPLDTAFATHVKEVLKDVLIGINRVYFSPDGFMYYIPVEHIIDDNREWLRLSSTRELTKKSQSLTRNLRRSNIILLGGLDYYAEINDSNAYISPKIKNPAIPAEESGMKIFRDIPRRVSNGVSPLPCTKDEVENIAESARVRGMTPTVMTGYNGTESAFYSIVEKETPGILHFATHGYYYTQDEFNDLQANNSFDDFEMEKQALYRSGLLLAGANRAMKNHKNIRDGNDGILTAHEVRLLNLRKTGLVVMSACQTGLGDISSDGVLGLQRGFKMAGAQALLMSLWKVHDRATQLLMNQFYDSLLEGKTLPQSLHMAQQALRDFEEKGIHPFDHPRYWAAFILLDGR